MPAAMQAGLPTLGWTFGATMLSWAFFMVLTCLAGAGLYLVFARPHTVPGHELPTRRGGQPAAGGAQAGATADHPGQRPADPRAGG